MIDSTFVKAITDNVKVEKFVVEDRDGVKRTYSTKSLNEVKPEPPPMLPKVSVYTLEGLAALIDQAKLDDLDKSDYFLQVIGHASVGLFAKESDEEGRRQLLISASPVEFEQFKFGQWLDQESFVIAVAAKFAPTVDKDYVLKLASTLTDEDVMTSEDNGFNQKATVKAGVKVAENVTIKPQVDLAPFRTFPELGQPISSFVFRCRKSPLGPQLMLIEADGGKWKIDAISMIETKLKEIVKDIDIVA